MMKKKSRYFEYKAKISKTYADLKKAYAEIRDSYAEMIFRFALIAEYRDESTGTHLVKIADYSTEIARETGLSKKDIDNLRYASPMHDIGKIVIPDAILKKPGGLTPEEREVMKTHTTLGGDIFKNSKAPLLRVARTISMTHHERFDGTGYPNGLRGADIPLFGRIVSVADVFDALTSKRPYKEAYGFDEAVELIKEGSGTQFDPAVVRAFLKRIEKIKQIWQATQDIELFLAEKDT
ncbi:MAG: HD domain-containing protein [Candidatus Omnitrophica bacterium]|nr:HD domain-containing protein [Candidatus Omnitrophota bacterium]